MTKNGRDHWNNSTYEQRTRLLCEMPLAVEDADQRNDRRGKIAVTVLVLFAIFGVVAMVMGWHL